MAPPNPSIPVNSNNIPPFSSLPLRASDPPYSAWGLYGPKDELGMLNRLTDPIVAAAAASEIRTGTRVSLNWPLDAQGRAPRKSFFQRAVFHQEIIPKHPRFINDDIWSFNSQVSSQWDGLRHFGYQKERKFYNGVTMEDIHGHDHDGHTHTNGGEGKSTVNGIQAWAEQGIVGRGILIDYHAWRESLPATERPDYDAFDNASGSAIPLSDLKKVLAWQNNTEVKFGDILLIRSGFMASHATKTDDQIAAYQAVVPHRFGGVEQSTEMLAWIWDNFSAVAGDQPSFECWPSRQEWAMHEVLLGGWGCPIGELFDLEALGEECKRKNRWSFFVTSEPCNVPGGVASPPNILAIF